VESFFVNFLKSRMRLPKMGFIECAASFAAKPLFLGSTPIL